MKNRPDKCACPRRNCEAEPHKGKVNCPEPADTGKLCDACEEMAELRR